jgi:hypothetical protein
MERIAHLRSDREQHSVRDRCGTHAAAPPLACGYQTLLHQTLHGQPSGANPEERPREDHQFTPLDQKYSDEKK